jgi:8-oxo-dGTP pyrophosphatase MutT (NUDIX family)
MLQSYKIFCGQLQIEIEKKILIDTFVPENTVIKQFSDEGDFEKLRKLLVVRRKPEKYIIIYHEPDKLLEFLKSRFHYIRAAGGVVKNSSGDILLIKYRNRWDLPKGKIQNGESKKDAAIREVKEECGLKKIEITGKKQITFHIGRSKGEKFIKKTFWYEMFTEDDSELKPARNEGITKAIWVPVSKIEFYLPLVYPNQRDLLCRNYLSNLQSLK